MKCEKYDVAIIGAGPCGIFTALELMKNKRIALFDVGKKLREKKCFLEITKKCVNCRPICNILGGFGGAQFFEGTKLSLYPAGTGLLKFTKNKEELDSIYDYVETILNGNGKKQRTYTNKSRIDNLSKKFEEIGIDMKYYNAQKVSKKTMNLIADNIYKKLKEKGVDIFLQTMVKDIEKKDNQFILKTDKSKFIANKVVIAVGRIGSRWLIKIADKLGIKYNEDHQIELGVRIEMPCQVFTRVNDIHNDLKLKRIISANDEMRTFCQDYKGFITKCVYNLPGDHIVSSLDGHIIGTDEDGGNMSQVVNIAIHHRFDSEKGIEQIYNLIKSMNHDGKPIVQSMKSFLLGEKTDNKIGVKLSMSDVVYDDINKYLPLKTLLLIKDFICRLDRVLPGFAHDNNAIYAPSFEMGWKRMVLSKNFETRVKGIFVGGDINGHFRGALQAMISGVIIGRAILNEQG